MKRLAAVFILSLFVLAACPPAGVCAEGGTAAQIVEAEGTAPVTGNDLARARNEAVRDALRKSVEQAISRWLTPADAAARLPLVKEQILDRAEGFIQEYRIVSEMTVGDVHTVAVRVSVLTDSLRDDLQRLGLAKTVQHTIPATHIAVTIRGIRSAGDYLRCRATLKEAIAGIREVIPREAAWNLVRFDVAAEGGVPVLIERMRGKLAVEVERQDAGAVEVRLK